jgi:hypothetical protein
MAAPPPPHADATLPVGGEALPDAARALCVSLLPSWASLAPADVAVSVISGGITNSLLKARRSFPAAREGAGAAQARARRSELQR